MLKLFSSDFWFDVLYSGYFFTLKIFSRTLYNYITESLENEIIFFPFLRFYIYSVTKQWVKNIVFSDYNVYAFIKFFTYLLIFPFLSWQSSDLKLWGFSSWGLKFLMRKRSQISSLFENIFHFAYICFVTFWFCL